MSGNDLEGHISSPKYVTPYLEGSKLYTIVCQHLYYLLHMMVFIRSLILPRYMSDHTVMIINTMLIVFIIYNVLRIISCETYCFVSKIFLQK